MARLTLAELNSHDQYITDWMGKYITQHVRAVGAVGHRRSGDKNHLLSVEVVIGYVDGFEPTFRQFKVGDVFSAHGRCNGNGQNVAAPNGRLDTDAINCAKCAKNLD